MSSTAAREAVAPQPFLMQERGWCSKCESEIHQENIEKNWVKPPYANRQHIEALCVKCGTLYELEREAHNGIFTIVEPGVRIVTDKRRIASFMRKTAARRGEIQV